MVSMVLPAASVLLLVIVLKGTTCVGIPGTVGIPGGTVEGRLVVPDTARVNNTLLKSAQADKFLSLWFIYILSDPVHTSSKPWTLLIPRNAGLPRGGGFLVEKDPTVRVLLNHAVLGHVVDPNDPPTTSLTTLAGSPLVFTTDERGSLVNGVRLTGDEYRFSDGVVYVLESSLPVLETPPTELVLEEELEEVTSSTRLPPLTHRFATFKPRRGGRPSEINTFRRTKPEHPAAVAPPTSSQAAPTSSQAPPSSSSSPAPTFSEFDGPTKASNDQEPFLQSFLESLKGNTAFTGSEFLHHFLEANITHRFRDTGRYTALVPYDSAFYSYYPIDWGFNPFLVDNFTKDVMANHFVRGNIALDDLPSLAELTTLGGRVIKFTRKGGKLLGNGVEVVVESETQLSRGRSYAINNLLFVDYDRVLELQAEHGDLETAPLLGDPWPTSQFLSHLLGQLEGDPRTSFFAEYLNLTNLAYLLPGHDENLDPLKYTAFIPVDNAIAETLYADAPDPFLLDEILRDSLVLNHLVRGRYYEKDLEDGLTVENLAKTKLTISRGPDNTLLVNNAQVIEPQAFVYNLGIVYLIDSVLGVTDQDIVKSINKFPDLHLEGATEESSTVGSNPLDEDPSTTPSRPTTPAPRLTTTSRPPTTRAPIATRRPTTTTRRPVTTHTPTVRATTRSHATTTRFFNVPHRPTSTSQPATTSPPEPTPTTPRIRFETRTEISISRQVDDGVVEPIDNPSS